VSSGENDPLKPDDLPFEPRPEEPISFDFDIEPIDTPEADEPIIEPPDFADAPEGGILGLSGPGNTSPDFLAGIPLPGENAVHHHPEAEAPSEPAVSFDESTLDFGASDAGEQPAEGSTLSFGDSGVGESVDFGAPATDDQAFGPVDEEGSASTLDFGGMSVEPAGESAADEGIAPGLLGLGVGEASATEEAATVEGEEKPAKEKGPSFLERLTEASPFTVLLGLTVAALLIAALLLLAEWRRYQYDTGARDARQAVMAPVERVVESTVERAA
jgi:hypothetical protein